MNSRFVKKTCQNIDIAKTSSLSIGTYYEWATQYVLQLVEIAIPLFP